MLIHFYKKILATFMQWLETINMFIDPVPAPVRVRINKSDCLQQNHAHKKLRLN